MRQYFAGLAGLSMMGTVAAAEVAGSLEWTRRIELSTPLSGVVEQVHVAPGERVRKGQPLLRLDQRTLKADLQKAEAVLARLQRLRNEARRELGRAQELYDRTLLSEHELELARIAAADADAAYQSAVADRVRAQVHLDYSVVRAPFDGLVLTLTAQAGQTVVTNLQAVPLVILAEWDGVLARVDLDEATLRRVAIGQSLTVRLDGRSYEGKVIRLGLEPVRREAGQMRYVVDVRFALEEGRVPRSGQALAVVIP